MKKLLSATLGLSAMLAAQTQAVPVIYEPFDITDIGDSVNGKTNGTGLDGNWTGYDSPNNLVIGSGSLSYGSLATGTGNHVRLSSTTDGRTGYSAALGSGMTAVGTGLLDDGDVVWFSFLTLHPTVSTNNRVHFYLGTDGSNAGGNTIANSGSGLGLDISGSGGNRMSAMAFVNGTRSNSAQTVLPSLETSLIVGKITWGATQDTIELYTPGLDLTLGDVKQTLTVNVNQSQFDLLVIAGKYDAPVVDEIRFGATSADVLPVPEPGSLALLGLGGLLVARRRRD